MNVRGRQGRRIRLGLSHSGFGARLLLLGLHGVADTGRHSGRPLRRQERLRSGNTGNQFIHTARSCGGAHQRRSVHHRPCLDWCRRGSPKWQLSFTMRRSVTPCFRSIFAGSHSAFHARPAVPLGAAVRALHHWRFRLRRFFFLFC